MKQITLLLFSLLFMFTASINIVLADVPQPKVKADHVANVFEKLKERITLFFKFSQDGKFDYLQFVTEKRLAELKYVIDSKQGNLVEETSVRYFTYLGNFTEFAIKNKMSGKKEELIKIYEEHQKILESLNKFEYESGFWLLIMHDINSTKIYSTQVKDSL